MNYLLPNESVTPLVGNGYGAPVGHPALPMQTGGIEPPYRQIGYQPGMVQPPIVNPYAQMAPHYNRLAAMMREMGGNRLSGLGFGLQLERF